MARIRTIKPEMAAHEGLFDLEQETELPIRFAWAMLPTVADREGRFQWRPRTLKAQILPHDLIDFSRVLDALLMRGFVVKYRVGNEWFGWIPTFLKHQVINNRESASDLPSYEDAEEVLDNRNQQPTSRDALVDDASMTREVRAQAEGKGREGKEGREEYAGLTPAASPPVRKANGHNPEQRKRAAEVIEFLNAKAGRAFDPKGANLEFVLARLKDGETIEDLRAVIAKKCREWKGDEKMAMYLRPETLFNRTKFASYKGELTPAGGQQ